MRRRFAVLLIGCIVAASGLAVANSITITTSGNIGDLKPHGLYTNGIDPTDPKKGSFQHRGDEAMWKVTITNTSKFKWTDFHIEIMSDGNVVDFKSPVMVTGWGTLGAQDFMTTLKTANFMAPAGQSVSPGSTIMLDIPVEDNGVFLAPTYHFDVNATVTPEPSSLLLLGTGLVGLVPLLRRKLRM